MSPNTRVKIGSLNHHAAVFMQAAALLQEYSTLTADLVAQLEECEAKLKRASLIDALSVGSEASLATIKEPRSGQSA